MTRTRRTPCSGAWLHTVNRQDARASRTAGESDGCTLDSTLASLVGAHKHHIEHEVHSFTHTHTATATIHTNALWEHTAIDRPCRDQSTHGSHRGASASCQQLVQHAQHGRQARCLTSQ